MVNKVTITDKERERLPISEAQILAGNAILSVMRTTRDEMAETARRFGANINSMSHNEANRLYKNMQRQYGNKGGK